jgi:UDP:flavonoid glycosyltransferase YjiC (YdhE family)
MRILLTACKGAGHYRPLLPVAHALQARGHEVRFATLADIAGDITGAGLTHMVLDGPTDAQRTAMNDGAAGLTGTAQARYFMREFFMGILARAALPGLLAAVQDWRPDLILRETTEFSGLIAAQALGIAHARLEVVNGESEESIATNYAASVDALRALAGLPAAGEGYLQDELSLSGHPEVLDDTPRVKSRAPLRFRPADLPTQAAGTGAGDWGQADGPPLVYVTFGTVAAGVSDSATAYRAALEALADLPVRALLTTGDGPEDLLGTVPTNVEVRRFVPQAEVLPHAAAMLCHGGSGTVLGGLAAGLPMVVAPLFADQPDNARCLAAAGLCLRVDTPDAPTLRAALASALADDGLRARAAAAAADIAAMPTLEQALDRLTAPAAGAGAAEA